MKTNPPGSPARWMIVDDNADIRTLTALLLAQLTDAPIETYPDGETALATFVAHPQAYLGIITDYEMPGIDGVELCRQIRAINPQQKIALATGSGFFTDAAALHAGFCALLSKPFLPATLRAVVAEMVVSPKEKNSADVNFLKTNGALISA